MADSRPKAEPKPTDRPPGQAPARAYSDDELLRRTEEFNQAAERYWQTLRADDAGRRHALNKPLSTVQDTPNLFYRLGLVLDALDLGVGLTVLDFGAGSCWLSSCLNRLRCRTIAMDVSPSALELGRELFATDWRHYPQLEPRFLPYDGHSIGLPDASVDRVVMFDAFHHVPNQQEVLDEIARVLRPGGRAVFGEPGEGHAHSDQSVYETENTGVLENDLDLVDVEQKALSAGFTSVLLKPYPNPSLTLPAADYRRLIDGDEKLYSLAGLRADLRHFYVFILLKGEPRFDSRNPRQLRGEIRLAGPASLKGRASEHVTFRARVKNTGDTLWLCEERPEGGFVKLGGHVFGEDRQLIARGHLQAELPRDVAPGEELELEARLLMPFRPGRYRLRLDLVDEFVAWFEQLGSQPVDVEVLVEGFLDSRAPHQLLAALEPPEDRLLRAARPGAALQLKLGLRNAGDSAWLAATADGAGAVALGGHLLAEDGTRLEWDFFRQPLPHDVEPGQRLELDCAFAAPPESGRYRLQVDCVADRVGWFESWGSQPVDFVLEVGDERPDSTAPGRLRAELELVPAEDRIAAHPGARVERRVRVRNTGNTLWLFAAGAGQVALGGHLRDARGQLLEQDLFRAPLSRDLAPGEQGEIGLAFSAPAAAGAYVLELDLLIEGLTWFGPRGSATLSLPLDVA